MKEEICERVLDIKKESIKHAKEEKIKNKWKSILEPEIKSNNVFRQFEKEIIDVDEKTETKICINDYNPSGYYGFAYPDSYSLYIYTYTRKWSRETWNEGLFGRIKKEEWEEWDSLFRYEILFIIDCKNKEITVEDERVYDYCKKFGKKHKFKKLIKCWDGVV